MPKLSIFCILILLIIGSAPLHSLGLGVFLGEPTGVTAAIDRIMITAAWDLSSTGSFQLNGDYWLLENALGEGVNYYVGVGARFFVVTLANRFTSENWVGLGLRVPVGLQYWLLPELELFAEYVPGFNILPATRYDHDWGIGLRYHFK